MNEIETIAFPVGPNETGAALLARPRTEGPHPAVVVLHDILQLTDDLHRILRRFADAGYVAMGPAYFGSGFPLGCIARASISLRRGKGEAFDRIAAAESWLAEREEVDGHRVGVVGFCIGGGFAVLHAGRGQSNAAAIFYGEVPQAVDELGQLPPCFVRYGGRDKLFAPQAEVLRGHLETLGVEHDLAVYPDAGHGFMSDHDHWAMTLSSLTPMKTRYDEARAEESWARMIDWFATHLGSAA